MMRFVLILREVCVDEDVIEMISTDQKQHVYTKLCVPSPSKHWIIMWL